MGSALGEIELTIVVEADDDDGGFVSEVLEHPGIASQGKTEDEAVRNAVDAFLCVLTAQPLVNVSVDDVAGTRRHHVRLPAGC